MGAAVTGVRDRALAIRPVGILAAAGCAASCLVVYAGGRIGPIGRERPPSDWWDLLELRHVSRHDLLAGGLSLGGVLALIGLWVITVRLARADRLAGRSMWWLSAAWSLPLVLGPPLFSSDVYTYAAQGRMSVRGIDVYLHGPSALGASPAARAVDVLWRHSSSPYGPVQTLISHAAVILGGRNETVAVLLLRGVALAALAATGVLAARLAGDRSALALALTVLNPLLLLQVLSPAHVEALMAATLLACLLAARRGRWVLAIVLGCVAGSIKAPAFLVVIVVLVAHARTVDRRDRIRTIGRDLLLAAVSVLALGLLVPDGFGWVRALAVPSHGYTFYAPVTVAGNAVHLMLPLWSAAATRAVLRVAGLALTAVVVVYLVATTSRRGLERTTGGALLAVGLLGPVVYPWYLAWGLTCLAPVAGRRLCAAIVTLSALGCVINPPGLPRLDSRVASAVFAAVALVVILAARWRGRQTAIADRAAAVSW